MQKSQAEALAGVAEESGRGWIPAACSIGALVPSGGGMRGGHEWACWGGALGSFLLVEGWLNWGEGEGRGRKLVVARGLGACCGVCSVFGGRYSVLFAQRLRLLLVMLLLLLREELMADAYSLQQQPALRGCW